MVEIMGDIPFMIETLWNLRIQSKDPIYFSFTEKRETITPSHKVIYPLNDLNFKKNRSPA